MIFVSTTFRTVLEAHSLHVDDHWERLLPMCLTKDDLSWFKSSLKGRLLSWLDASNLILDHFHTPYRQFVLQLKIYKMKQGDSESIRSYAAKYQKLRRQTNLEDGQHLILAFWTSVKPSIRDRAAGALASRYGNDLPKTLEQVIQYLITSTNDSDFLAGDICHEYIHTKSDLVSYYPVPVSIV